MRLIKVPYIHTGYSPGNSLLLIVSGCHFHLNNSGAAAGKSYPGDIPQLFQMASTVVAKSKK